LIKGDIQSDRQQTEDFKKDLAERIQKWKFQRAVFSLGIIPLKEYVLNKLGVEGFVTEDHPNDLENFEYRDKCKRPGKYIYCNF